MSDTFHYNKYIKYKKKNKKLMNKIKDTIPFIIVPKNTLLFRVVHDSITDFVGVKLTKENISEYEKNNDNIGKYCIPKEYNVFFYLSPFVADGMPEWFSEFKNIEIYATNYDIKVLSLIGNSRYNRSMRYTSDLATSCDKIDDSCISGRYYDLCFSQIMIKKYPEIMGWISVTRNDAKKFMNQLENGDLKDPDVKKYIHLTKDNRGVIGPAEIALYPLKKRINENKYIKDVDKWINNNEFNYRHITKLPRDKQKIIEFMEQYSIFNEKTKFYEYRV